MSNFQITRWSLIDAARGEPAIARPALEALCRTYRPPVLAYIRHRGHPASEAEDLAQSFFVHFLERGGYASADPHRGRFRALLLTALQRFLRDQQACSDALKRGGARRPQDWDPDLLPSPTGDPEAAFSRVWLNTLLARAMQRLCDEWTRAGKRERFDQLAPLLLEPGDRDALADLAACTGVRRNTLSVQATRLRRRLRQLVRLELLQTVGNPEALERELRDLRELAGG